MLIKLTRAGRWTGDFEVGGKKVKVFVSYGGTSCVDGTKSVPGMKDEEEWMNKHWYDLIIQYTKEKEIFVCKGCGMNPDQKSRKFTVKEMKAGVDVQFVANSCSVDLRNADLSSVCCKDLRLADLSSVDLHGADLSGLYGKKS